MIEIDRLSKSFGPFRAVDGISFSVRRGEVLGFLGPNGAGKSTTMKMITGYLDPTSGTARVCGHDVREEPIEVKRKLGYLPEGAPLYAEMTPRGLLTFVAELRGLDGRELANAVGKAVERQTERTIDLHTKVDPEILVLMPCGFDLQKTVDEWAALSRPEGWTEMRAVQAGRVFAVDGSAYFSRPGPHHYEFWNQDWDGITPRALGIALLWAMVSTRLGLWWGQWMARVRR